MSKLPPKSPHCEDNKAANKKCLLLYSGGVDTSICVHLLSQYYGYEVITLTIDVCQDEKICQQMAVKAKKLGATKTIVYDAKKEFADKYISQVIKANGFYDDHYPLGTSLARPMQAALAVKIAQQEKVDAVAHGCKGRGADAFRLNMVFNYLLPDDIELVLPINDWWPTRQEEIDFAYANKIPVPVPQDNPYSYDDNILSNAINYGSIDDIKEPAPEKAYKWTVPAQKAPAQPQQIQLGFKEGLPVSLDGKKISLDQLMIKLNQLGGKHGIGRMDMIENGLYGNKFRWIYEAPAAEILISAHQELEKLALPAETLYFKQEVADKKWAKAAYKSFFYSPLTSALMKLIDETQQYVTGKVTLQLYKGKVSVIKRVCANTLTQLDPKDLVPQETMDKVPYGFEEYAFASKHQEVIGQHFSN